MNAVKTCRSWSRACSSDLGHPGLPVVDACYEALRAHAWPGNVRELKNKLACAVAFVDPGGPLEPSHLQLLTPTEDDSAVERLPLGGQPLERIERAAIRQTLLDTRGNKVLAAQSLGIAVSTLYEKIKKYKI
ncbi:MAG: helix-turn-helix domain-containing protein [Polyangiaceae bacterium]